jgi:hypothetical protein
MLLIPGAQVTNAGNYRVVISNASGSVTSVIATLRVLLPAVMTNASVVGTNINFSFKTVTGLNYTIEYKTNLNDASWLALRALAGGGTNFTFSDPVTVAPRRFYRIRVE